MKHKKGHLTLLMLTTLWSGFSTQVAANSVPPSSGDQVLSALNEINGFIDRRGGLDRVQEDAEGGDAAANYWLGVMHRDGVVFEKDSVAAESYFSVAAEQGHASGLYEYSHQVAQGAGPISQSKALQYLAESATEGKSEAQYEMALNYLSGEGVPRSHTLGYFWLSKAALNGYAPAVEKERELIERNADLTLKFDAVYERAITGHVPSMVKLASFYEKGIKVERNPAMAREFLLNAARLGSKEAKLMLAD